MKIIFLILITFFPGTQLFHKNDDIIKWNENRKLTWDDFKASPLKVGSAAAITNTHLGFSYSMVNGKLTYSVECWFEKNRSWGLVKNDWILKHEQGHFDIAEIFARKLNKRLNEYSFNKNTYYKDLDVIYKNVVKENKEYQQLYDDETDYSRINTKQEEWLKRINEDLTQLKPWSDY